MTNPDDEADGQDALVEAARRELARVYGSVYHDFQPEEPAQTGLAKLRLVKRLAKGAA